MCASRKVRDRIFIISLLAITTMPNTNENMPYEREGSRPASRSDSEGESVAPLFRDSVDRFFDDDSLWDPMQFFRSSRFGRRMFPRVDVRETDTTVRVVADVPGVDPENINVHVIGNRMTISGRLEQVPGRDEKSYRNERIYGEFRREFTLPARVKEEEIKAVHKDGVLTITMPKRDEEIRKKIPIERQ
jgi:HSP20 family protein